MLDEMINRWEKACWSKHVCNETAPEVTALVTSSAATFKSGLDFLLPEDYKDTLLAHDYETTIDIQTEHISITLIKKERNHAS